MAALGDRSDFPDLEVPHYLNHAAVGPSSAAVRAAMDAAVAQGAARGLAAIHDWLDARDAVRGAFGTLVGGRPEDVAVVPNTSSGVTAIALCRPWRDGDRVVVFGGEFPANVTPWQRAAELFGLEVAFVDAGLFFGDDGRGLAALEAELRRGGVALVAVSAVQFATGLRLPVGAIGEACRRHGAELFVDGIQACGVTPVDVEADAIDYLAAGGHKWLMGPMGAGVLWIRPERGAVLRPHLAGWLSHEQPMDFLTHGPDLLRYDRGFQPGPALFEGGVWNAAGCAGLAAGIAPLNALGPEAIAAHVIAIGDALEAGLTELGCRSVRSSLPEQRSAILSVVLPGDRDLAKFAHDLGERGVQVATPDGLLRFSPHWHNSVAEVPSVLDAVREVLG